MDAGTRENPAVAFGLAAARLDVEMLCPAAATAMRSLTVALRRSTVEARLRELTQIRASQINGAAYSVAAHTAGALAAGDPTGASSPSRSGATPHSFTVRERSALALTEAISRPAADRATPRCTPRPNGGSCARSSRTWSGW